MSTNIFCKCLNLILRYICRNVAAHNNYTTFYTRQNYCHFITQLQKRYKLNYRRISQIEVASSSFKKRKKIEKQINK